MALTKTGESLLKAAFEPPAPPPAWLRALGMYADDVGIMAYQAQQVRERKRKLLVGAKPAGARGVPCSVDGGTCA